MKNLKKLKRNDWILVGIIIGVTLLCVIFHVLVGGKGAGSVTVKVAGKIEGVYSLAEDREIKINNGSNILVIKNHQADMTEADCPDQLCVKQKPVSRNHESLICLPNKVVVEVDSSENSEFDAVSN